MKAFSQFSGNVHTSLINEYQQNYDAIMSKQEIIRINYREEIRMKSDAKKIKYYQISKNLCNLSANSLAMITHFFKMSINKIMMLLCENSNKLELII